MALAKKSMNAATQSEEARLFLYSQEHISKYHRTYAQHDINHYGPIRRLIIKDENGEEQQLYYTHTTPAPLGTNIEALAKDYNINDAQVVWHGPKSRVLYFGADIQAPKRSSQTHYNNSLIYPLTGQKLFSRYLASQRGNGLLASFAFDSKPLSSQTKNPRPWRNW